MSKPTSTSKDNKHPAAVALGKLGKGSRKLYAWRGEDRTEIVQQRQAAKKQRELTRSKHPGAVALGKLAKGKPKTMTPAALAARRKTAQSRRKVPVKPLSDEEVQLPPGPMGAGALEEDVD